MIDNATLGPAETISSASAERDLLDRIRLTGQLEPGDFPRLTRLIYLEAFAMCKIVVADLRYTQVGGDLENQTAALLADAEDLDLVVREWQGIGPPTTEQTQARYGDILVTFRSMEASLSQLQGLSPQATRHYRDLAQLIAIADRVIAPTASLANRTVGRLGRVASDPELDRLNQLAIAVVTEIERLKLAAGSDPATISRTGPATVGEELINLVRLVRAFQQLLEAGAAIPEIGQAWRVIRSRMWEFERRIKRQTAHPEWRRGWQTVRSRYDAVSAELQLPRVLIGSTGPAVVVARPDAAALERVDQALGAVAKVGNVLNTRSTTNVRVDPRTVEDLGQLQVRLLQLRILLLASVHVKRESPLVRDLDAVDRAMRRRTQAVTIGGQLDRAGGADQLREMHRLVVKVRDGFGS